MREKGKVEREKIQGGGAREQRRGVKKKIFMTRTDLYAAIDGDLDQIASRLTDILNIQFEAHDNSFLGEYYLYKDASEQRFRLQYNYVPEQDDWIELDLKDYQILFYVYNAINADVIEETIEQSELDLELIRSYKI